MPKSLDRRSRLPRRIGIAAAFLALAVLPFHPSPVSASRSAEMHALSLLPASADLVVWADYFALRKSDLVAEMERRIDSIPEAAEHYREFVRETGLDPRQDTDQVLLSLRSATEAGGSGFLLIAQGRFAGNRILETAAEKGGALTTPREGVRIWISQEAARPEDPSPEKTVVALAEIDGTTLLFGEESEVLRAADVAGGAKRPETKEPRFRDLLAGADRKAPVWAVLNSRSLAAQISSEIARNNSEWKPGEAVASVDSIQLACWVGKDLDMKIQVGAKDAESAGLLGDLFRGAVAAGKLAAKDRDPELLSTLQELTIEEDGKGIEVRVRIPGSRIRSSENFGPAGEARAD